MILTSSDYAPGDAVFFLGCEIGAYTPQNEAMLKKLSKLINAPVFAPDTYIWFEENGNYSLFDKIRSKEGLVQNKSKPGNFKIYDGRN